MNIILAKTAGFCFGVRRAVRLAEEAAEKYKDCVTLGPIIHNKSVVEMLEGKGAAEIEDVAQAKPGQTVIIRSHGIGRDEYERLCELDVNVVDATCPDVSAIHAAVRKESRQGHAVLIIGEREHPEVKAIAGWCNDAVIAETPEEVRQYIFDGVIERDKPILAVSQTTGNKLNFENSVNCLKKECTNFKIIDTICKATSLRQEEARKLSEHCDAMIVIGGKHSANSKRLADICKENCSKVFFVEDASELNMREFEGVVNVGITAGASTPAWSIKEVYHKMIEENKVVTTENMQPEETVQEIAEEIEKAPEAESFEEMLEKSIRTLHTGEKVTGVIAAITGTEVSVDLGIKQSGYIPYSELTDDPNVKPEDIVKVGDEIETYVMRVNDVEGTVMLSKKRVDASRAWDIVNKAMAEKTAMEGYVVEENKGGVVVNVKGIRVFVPASQTGLPKEEPMTSLLKTNVKLRITEVNQPRRRVVGSIRAVANEERRARIEQIWNEIEVGKHYNGTVKSMTSYGAFVDIGGIDGMVHVSELSWSRIHQPSDVLSVGDKIEVYVISFDKDKRKISLGYKNPTENPWLKFTGSYEVGSTVNVKIVKLMPFGAFAEIVPGVDGLIHISQIADRRIGKPEDVLTEGQMVDAKVIEIDNEKQKVSLSIRALLAPAPRKEPESEDIDNEVVYDTDAAEQ